LNITSSVLALMQAGMSLFVIHSSCISVQPILPGCTATPRHNQKNPEFMATLRGVKLICYLLSSQIIALSLLVYSSFLR